MFQGIDGFDSILGSPLYHQFDQIYKVRVFALASFGNCHLFADFLLESELLSSFTLFKEVVGWAPQSAVDHAHLLILISRGKQWGSRKQFEYYTAQTPDINFLIIGFN